MKLFKGLAHVLNCTFEYYNEFWKKIVQVISALLLIIVTICLSIFNPYFKDVCWNYPEETYRELETEAELFIKELEETELSDIFDKRTKQFSAKTLCTTRTVTVTITDEETNISRDFFNSGAYYFNSVIKLFVLLVLLVFCISLIAYILLFFIAIIKWIIWISKTIKAYKAEKRK